MAENTPYALGARLRPPDPNEMKYHASFAFAGLQADLTQTRSLGRFHGFDVRPEIEDQGPIGACSAFSAVVCARICAVVSGRLSKAPMLSGDWLYEQSRRKEGTFPHDAGSYLADNLDILLNQGAPLESDCPEKGDAAYDYGSGFDNRATGQEWIANHHVFGPSDGQVLENIWIALDQGLPVHLGQNWAQAWFNPTKGMVADVGAAASVGGHATAVWGITPESGGYVLVANQWSSSWAPDAPESGLPDMRPGDYAIPWVTFRRPDTPIFECRAVTAKPFTPNPQPTPPPTDRFWAWLAAVSAYAKAVGEPARALEAQVVDDQVERFYTGVR